MKKDGKVYIYNKYQAIYYMQNGLIPLDVDVHSKTKRIFFVFKRNEHEAIFGEWINRKPIKQKIIEINIDKEIKKQMFNNLNIYEGRINDIGKKKNSKMKQPLSRTWFMENDEETLKQLRNNIYSYFKRITKGKSKYNCWTIYKEYERQFIGDGYTKGFVNSDCELSKLNNCKNFAYIMNKYPSDLEKDNNEYANLLTIYDLIRIVKYITVDLDHKLNLYVPSERVRTLFKEWLVS